MMANGLLKDVAVAAISSASSNAKLFVPRTVAPKSDEKWWRTSDNPCLARYNGTVLPNCFDGDTEFITTLGVMKLKDAVGLKFEVPTIDGCWHEATAYYFGVQRVYRVTLDDSIYYATAHHVWYIYDYHKKLFKTLTTSELKPRMKIWYRMCNTETFTHVVSVEDTEIYRPVYCVVEPVTHSFTLSGGEITGNCVGYAYGRFAEILGYFHPELPRCNAGLWIDVLKKSKTSLKWGSTPKLGAAAVWKKPGSAGHVAIVEYIYENGSIMLSESGYSASWSTRFWTSGPRTAPNWYGRPYVFQGFIYNPATEGNIRVAPFSGGIKYGTRIPENSPRYSGSYTGSTTTISSDGFSGISGEIPGQTTGTYYGTAPDHPARRFVRTAISHAGKDGKSWVKSKTSIGNQSWSAAMCCAVAIECEFNSQIMPGSTYVAANFGKDIVEKYGGKYIAGGLRGGTESPQVGDIFELDNRGNNSKYSSTDVGIVRELAADTILTVEVSGDSIILHRRRLSDIAWYARPDWTKVGGTGTVESLMASPLYKSSSTRADASIREVAYLTESCEPSIDLTSIKLSVVNYTSVLSAIYDAAGYSNQVMYGTTYSEQYSEGCSVDSSHITPPNARIIFEFLTSKGLTAAQAVGFLANIQQESNFSPSAVNPSSRASGICQWLGARKTAMIRVCGTNWSNNLSGQCEYLWTELNGAESKTLTRLKSEVTTNDESAARMAADIVLRQFERPGNYSTESPKRQNNASKFWSMIRVMSNASGGLVTSGSSGKIVTRSGKVITSGNAVIIPSSVKQTGIVANSTNWVRFYSRWSRRVNQGKLADIWNQQGRPSKYYIATISGYYLIAVTTKFGMPGDIVSVVLEDGSYFNAIIGDSKGANVAYSPHAGETGNKYGHAFGRSGAVDVIEWEANGGSQSQLLAGIKQAGWHGKKVVKIVNYGSWING